MTEREQQDEKVVVAPVEEKRELAQTCGSTVHQAKDSLR